MLNWGWFVITGFIGAAAAKEEVRWDIVSTHFLLPLFLRDREKSEKIRDDDGLKRPIGSQDQPKMSRLMDMFGWL